MVTKLEGYEIRLMKDGLNSNLGKKLNRAQSLLSDTPANLSGSRESLDLAHQFLKIAEKHEIRASDRLERHYDALTKAHCVFSEIEAYEMQEETKIASKKILPEHLPLLQRCLEDRAIDEAHLASLALDKMGDIRDAKKYTEMLEQTLSAIQHYGMAGNRIELLKTTYDKLARDMETWRAME